MFGIVHPHMGLYIALYPSLSWERGAPMTFGKGSLHMWGATISLIIVGEVGPYNTWYSDPPTSGALSLSL